MKAILLQKERIKLADDRFAAMVVWQLPQAAPGSVHGYKYRMALVVREICVLRYDNEAGKGDHKHVAGIEMDYAFSTLDQLVEDFWADVATL